MLTTIHQPASRLYQMLDKLMLLSEGHVIYYGADPILACWHVQAHPHQSLLLSYLTSCSHCLFKLYTCGHIIIANLTTSSR